MPNQKKDKKMTEFTPTRAWVKEQMKISRERGTHADFSNLDFSGLDLSNLNLTNAIFDYATLIGTNLRTSNLNNVSATFADFRNADMSRVETIDANFEGSDFRDTNMYGMNAYMSRFIQCDMRGINAKSADFDNADFTMANMCGANLYKAKTHGTVFHDAMLFEAVLNDDIHRASLYCANVDALVIPGIPLTFLPTLEGWRMYSQSWQGTIDGFRKSISSGDWVSGVGNATFAELTAAADLCDAFATARPDAVAEVRATAEKWEVS